MARHLDKLPPKSFDVAPGDVVGGLIYVMDKPLGIEEGMVGISIDSEYYRNYVKETVQILEQIRKGEKRVEEIDAKAYPNIKDLAKRYADLYQENNGFDGKTEKETIDTILKDKIHEKKRHGASWKEFKNVFFSLSKYHEMKGWQSYYVNKGMGGLLFEAYKNKCEIKKNDHFAVHIGKLTKNGDKAYMIKQDGEMHLGGTGPGWNKMLKTNTGKSLQRLVNPFVIIFTGGLSALAFGIGMLSWRAFYLKKNKPTVSNSEAIIEALSTKMAAKRGLASQEIDTIDGTYVDGQPKVATIVTWANGCRDLSGKLSGSTDWSSVVVTWDKNDNPVKVDKEGNIFRTKDKNDKGKITSYEKILKGGKTVPATKEEYDNAKAVSDDRIAGLGESLISFISMGDRDGIGKAGQNKAILPLNPPQGNKAFQFFGIDFGKSYKEANPIVESLKDDFSFDNPAGRQSRFVNYSMLYDNPLREKMKGIYLLAALRDQLPAELKEAIAKEYETDGDKHFADKLRAYPGSQGGANCDLKVIDDDIKKYEDLSKNDGFTAEQKEEYAKYALRLKDMRKIAFDTDNTILGKFAARSNLPPKQIDLLDNIEKLTSRNVHTLSPDGKVQLNHLRVDRNDRCAWQLNDNKNDTFTLICEEAQRQNDVKQRLLALHSPEINEILSRAKIDKGKLVIENLTKEEITKLSQHITEENVARTRHVPYRSEAMRDSFHHRIRMSAHVEAKKKQKDHQIGPRELNNPIVNVNIAKRIAEVPIEPPLEKVKPLVSQFRSMQPMQIAKMTTQVVAQHKASFEEIGDFLSKDENLVKLGIVHVQHFETTAFTHKNGVAVTFKDSDKNIEGKFFIQQTPEGVRFSFPKDLSPASFTFAAKAMSDFIAATAKVGHEFEVSPLSLPQKGIVEEALKAGIEKAISHHRFDNASAPQLKGDSPKRFDL